MDLTKGPTPDMADIEIVERIASAIYGLGWVRELSPHLGLSESQLYRLVQAPVEKRRDLKPAVRQAFVRWLETVPRERLMAATVTLTHAVTAQILMHARIQGES